MSASQNPHQFPSGDKKSPENPTVWEIMQTSVNDNTPGYKYWLVRIVTTSVICALLLGAIRHWMM